MKFFLVSLFVLIGLLFSPTSAHAQDPRVYVANEGSNSVSVIDSSTNGIITTIPVGNSPRGVALSPDGNKLYVSNYNDWTVSVVDATNYIITHTVFVGNFPGGLIASPDGTRLYVSNNGQQSVSVINTSNNTVLTTIPVAIGPWHMSITANGALLYVSSAPSDIISVIDTATNTVQSTIPVTGGPTGIALNASGSRLYVANGAMTVIDTVTHNTIASLPTTSMQLAINTANTRVYGSNDLANSVSVVDATTNSEITTVPLLIGSNPSGIAVLPDDTRTYVANNGGGQNPASNTVSVIDTSNNTVTDTIIVGLHPIAIVIEKIQTTPPRQITALSPAKIWISLKNGDEDEDDIRLDLLAEVYKDTTLISSGQINSVSTGGSRFKKFKNARLQTIAFNAFSPVDFPTGSSLKIKLSVRNACIKSSRNSGVARLWYNDAIANSQFGATIGSTTNSYFLRNGFILATTAGPGPKETIDVQAGSRCSAFKPFGTWTITP